MRIKRTRDGLLEQPYDVYIAGKVQNDHWQLPWSEWANPYYNKHDALELYAEHVRRRISLWHKLDSLEGKLLGCWCKDETKCHGSVLIRLLDEKKTMELKSKFKKCGLIVDTSHLEQIRRAYDWADNQHLLAYATRLDRTNVFYFQEPVLEAILRLWNIPRPRCWPARTRDNQVYLVVGLYDGPQPLGPFWDDQADLEVLYGVAHSLGTVAFYPAMPNLIDLFVFAKQAQTLITEQPECLKKALVEALRYHTLHRCVVRRVGHVNQVDMDDHDLSKSRIVQVALAYWHHWQGPHLRGPLLDAAINAVRAGHCELENHHPEYALAQCDRVDEKKLIVDRLAVHLQKDPVDKQNGWEINLAFIPTEYRRDWDEFKRTHNHKDLYDECLYRAKKELEVGCDLYKRFPEEQAHSLTAQQ